MYNLSTSLGDNVDLLNLRTGSGFYAFMSHVDRWYARL